MKYTAGVLSGLALVSSATAHLFIQSPPPIAGSGIKQPLDASGSDFPCHGVAIPTSGGMSMPVGSVQQLVFDGGANGENTAVHGGGSCQISITYKTDAQEVKDPANWKVLYSIEGGCPTNSPMNLDSGYQGPSGSYSGSRQCNDTNTNGYDCLNSFAFPIPKEVKNGQATLGWTWFNNVGNREMYMNCVSVAISGGQSDDTALSSLPSLFVANVAAKGVLGTCKTSERSNVGFPAPGKYVTTKRASTRNAVATATDYPIAVPSGCGLAASYGGSGDSGSSGDAASSAAAPAPAPATTSKAASVAAPAPAPAPATTLKTTTTPAAQQDAGTSSPIKRPVATTTSTTTTKLVAKTTAAAAKPTTTATPAEASTTGAAAAAATPATTDSKCGAGRVSCGTLGSIICIGQSKFGICDYGGCAVAQAVAPGTACINGGITWAPAAAKKRLRRHLAQHVNGGSAHSKNALV